MRDLRDVIRAVGERVTPAPDALSRAQDSIRRRARWRRVRAGVLGAGIFLIAVTSVTLAPWHLSRPGRSASSASSLSITIGNSANVSSPGQLSSVVFGEGSLWVSVGGTEPKLIELDPETLKQRAQVSVSSVPAFTSDGGGLAFSPGSLWEAGQDPRGGLHAVVRRIDPTNGEVRSTISVLGQIGVDVTWANGSLWVLSSQQDGSSSYVTELSPSLDMVGRYRIRNLHARGIVVTANDAWVWGRDLTNLGRVRLFDVDLQTGEIKNFAGQTKNVISYAVQGDRIVAGGMDGVQVFSSDGSLLETLDLPASRWKPPLSPWPLGGVWVGQRTGGQYSISLATFDGAVVRSPQVPGTPIAIASTADSAWLLTFEGDVVALHVR